ncbi:MAG TPA: glucosidase [Bryobacteraceae bacterium]|nr:glucosidase [Bryobacteraceae bacterium]
MNPEQVRLSEDARREKDWKRWGPYLAERQWGTVREDYSASGDCWNYFPHDHARSRAYRWGEDGLMGLCDRQGRMCFALALWNGKDPILKERLYGLNGEEGNHGEDVKECYFYLDSTPTHSYMKALYKYPQRAYPYEQLLRENKRRSRHDREFELLDTGVFAESRYFDIQVEYAKASPNDVLIRLRIDNRGPEAWTLHVLPTVWFRNGWSWGRTGEGYWPKPSVRSVDDTHLACEQQTLGKFTFEALTKPDQFLFTENETNSERLFNAPNAGPYVKDAFHRYVVGGEAGAVNPAGEGTKAAAYYRVEIPSGGGIEYRFRLCAEGEPEAIDFDGILGERILEADLFYGIGENAPYQLQVARNALASLLWSKQLYLYGVLEWLEGDPVFPTPPPQRWHGRNCDWTHLYNRDVVSMPDTWEFPWYASWDLAFHMVAMAEIDPALAKDQLVLLLREWYMHPNGQIPAYEFAFGDVNPPVHAWAAWRVYKISAPYGQRDQAFLERVFQKLLLNFTWWVNRKDVAGKQVFSGGFLGLDNIGVFDRSQPLPGGGVLEQADGTAWMACYCATMLSIALELSIANPAYEDIASKFFEHFVAIVDAMNSLGGLGLWDEEDGFYYDQVHTSDGKTMPLKLRSIVGLIPLLAVAVLEEEEIDRLPGFRSRLLWFLRNRGDLYQQISMMESAGSAGHNHRLLAIPTKERLLRVLRRMLDEGEFLSPFGIRSLSAVYGEHPYVLQVDGTQRTVAYDPGESTTELFGGNSNWRGPIWFPMNYLLMEALERYHHFYGDELKVECPTGSGTWMTLREVAREINRRLCSLFTEDGGGYAPWQGDTRIYAEDPHWSGLRCFNEYFHADTGRGCGASHQTGWTALIARCMQDLLAASAETRDPARNVSSGSQ